MNDNVVLQFTPRRQHVPLVERIRRDAELREASKARVQKITDDFCADTWRGNKFADAQIWCDRALRHPLGGREWVLQALERLRSYVESRGY